MKIGIVLISDSGVLLVYDTIESLVWVVGDIVKSEKGMSLVKKKWVFQCFGNCLLLICLVMILKSVVWHEHVTAWQSSPETRRPIPLSKLTVIANTPTLTRRRWAPLLQTMQRCNLGKKNPCCSTRILRPKSQSQESHKWRSWRKSFLWNWALPKCPSVMNCINVHWCWGKRVPRCRRSRRVVYLRGRG